MNDRTGMIDAHRVEFLQYCSDNFWQTVERTLDGRGYRYKRRSDGGLDYYLNMIGSPDVLYGHIPRGCWRFKAVTS